MKLISEVELRELLAAYEKLLRLEDGRVENWEWYKESLTDYDDWKRNKLDKILDKYINYIKPEIEDYYE